MLCTTHLSSAIIFHVYSIDIHYLWSDLTLILSTQIFLGSRHFPRLYWTEDWSRDPGAHWAHIPSCSSLCVSFLLQIFIKL